MAKITQKPKDVSCDGNSLAFAIKQLIGNYAFIDLAEVVEVNADQTVDVKRLVLGTTAAGNRMEPGVIYNIPYMQLRRGASAVIMDPVEGDLGIIVVCDKDISNVKSTKKSALPGTERSHSYGDAIYLTGIASLNSDPIQYVHFRNDGIDVVSPMVVTVSAPTIELNGDNRVSLNAPQIVLNGQVTQGAGSHAGAAVFKNGATTPADFAAGSISLKSHRHGGVQTGSGSTGTPTV
ncbi:oxidoreductase [Enterobacteriaceae bacterium ML5]|nr:oxidoreductase [Enterobacteriaceae bacterium ML5]